MSDSSVVDQFRLLSLIREKSYREGDFTLASGKKSSFYVDLKATTLHPDGADLVGRLMVARLREMGYAELGGVGGLTLGADPMATAVSLAALREGLKWPAYIVRKEPKDHGTAKYLEGSENINAALPLAVLEDVVTTGGSSIKAVERLRDAGYKPEVVIAIVDRQQGGAEAFAKLGVKFVSLLTLEQVRAGKLA